MARNPSWKTYRNRYNQTARELARSAAQERIRNALRLCLSEIDQFHSRAYPDCKGDCPAHEAMAAAQLALAEKPK